MTFDQAAVLSFEDANIWKTQKGHQVSSNTKAMLIFFLTLTDVVQKKYSPWAYCEWNSNFTLLFITVVRREADYLIHLQLMPPHHGRPQQKAGYCESGLAQGGWWQRVNWFNNKSLYIKNNTIGWGKYWTISGPRCFPPPSL